MTVEIDKMHPRTGRIVKEDGNTINEADLMTGAGIKVSNGPAEYSVNITRPANTTAYAAGQIVGGSATTLLFFDLGASNANRKFILAGARMHSPNGAAATKLQVDLHFFDVNNPQASTADQQAFAVADASVANLQTSLLSSEAVQPDIGTDAYIVGAWTEKQRIMHADAQGRVYVCPVARTAGSTASGEVYGLTIKVLLQ